MQTDELAALVAFLRADAGVSALAGARVWGVELPAEEASSMPRTAVIINSVPMSSMSQTGRSFLRIAYPTKDVKCYGATHVEARQLWNAVDESLVTMRRAVRSGVLLYSAIRTGGPQSLRDQAVDWPMVIASYEIMAAEVA